MDEEPTQLGLFDLLAGDGPAQPLPEALPAPTPLQLPEPAPEPQPPADPEPDPPQPAQAASIVADAVRVAPDLYMPPSGAVSRVRSNLAAVALVEDIDAGRVQLPLSDQQRAVLAEWSSWGAVSGVFDDDHAHLGRFADEVRDKLSGQGAYEAGRRTILNAHYTSAAVASAMWDFAAQAGFTEGRALEPGCGGGMFIAAAPDSMHMTGVEADPTTARIASLLHPQATIVNSELQTWQDPGGFDLAIGNVPFSKVAPFDARLNRDRNLSLHNYCLLRSLDALRPGGLLISLTSMFTMDATGRGQRETLSRWGEFLGAVRLPNTAFRANAGTAAVTDIVVMRRREEVLDSLDETRLTTAELHWLATNEVENGWHISRWYRKQPHLMLGQLAAESMYNGEGHTLDPNPGEDLDEALRAAFESEPMARIAQIIEQRAAEPLAAAPIGTPTREPAGRLPTPQDAVGHAREGTIVIDGDGFLQLRQGRFVPYERPGKRADREGSAAELRAALNVRDAGLMLLAAEKANDPDAVIDTRRDELNAAYDAHKRLGKGPLSRRPLYPSGRTKPHRLSGFADDPHYGLVCALEDPALVQAGAEDVRGPWFRQRALGTEAEVNADAVGTIEEAVAASLHETGAVWLDVVNAKLGANLRAEDLAPAAFLDPEAGDSDTGVMLEPAGRYLSGDIRAKLRAAEAAAAAGDARFEANVHALGQVRPEPLAPEDISVELGVPWITPEEVQEFARDTLGHRSVAVTYIDGDWNVDTSRAYINRSTLTEVWGVPLMPADAMLEKLLAREEMLVHNPKVEGEPKTVNAEQTMTALSIADQWQNAFTRWCMVENAERRDELTERYNDRYRSWVVATYPEWRQPAGLVDGFEYRPHQLRAVTRVILEGGMLLGHEVGGGKTASMVGAAMEMRRLGIARRPVAVIPNNLVSQFAREWQTLFPTANLLVYDLPSNRTAADYRNEFGARCATGDWDGVIMPYTAFAALPISSSNAVTEEMQYLAELEHRADKVYSSDLDYNTQSALSSHYRKRKRAQESKVRSAVAAARGLAVKDVRKWSMDAVLEAGSRTAKEEEQARMARQEALRASSAGHTSALSWEDLDVDYVFVDEGHLFKNLRIESKSPLVRSARSTRAMDLDRKLRWLRQQHDGESRVTIATGTPVANALSELWVMQNYVQPEILERTGLSHFDSWLAMFGKQETKPEVDFKGAWRMNTRLTGYRNLPELMAIAGQDIELLTAAQMGLPRPELAGGDARIVEIPSSPEIRRYIDGLAAREERVRNSMVPPEEDNMLAIYGSARSAALDLRLVGLTQPLPCKIETAADEIARLWVDKRDMAFDAGPGVPHPRRGALQMVFCDLGTPSGDAKLNVYEHLRSALVERGLERERVAFFHDRGTTSSKIARFDTECRTGGFDVLLASTGKAGVGLNVQDRLVAMHHLDAPWRPADVVQREGRMLRQGNQCEEVESIRYVQLGTFDSFAWQTLERKATFIEELTALAPGQRESESIDADLTASFSNVKAVATGDPRMIRELELVEEAKRLRTMRRAHQQAERRIEGKIADNDGYIGRLRKRKVRLAAAAETIAGDGDRAVFRDLDGNVIDDNPNRALRDIAARECHNDRDREHDIATVNGLPVRARWSERTAYWFLGDDLGMSSTVPLDEERNAKPAQRIVNMLREIGPSIEAIESTVEQTRADSATLRSQLDGEWPDADKLVAVDTELDALRRDMHENPLRDVTSATVAAAFAAAAGESVLPGTELDDDIDDDLDDRIVVPAETAAEAAEPAIEPAEEADPAADEEPPTPAGNPGFTMLVIDPSKGTVSGSAVGSDADRRRFESRLGAMLGDDSDDGLGL